MSYLVGGLMEDFLESANCECNEGIFWGGLGIRSVQPPVQFGRREPFQAARSAKNSASWLALGSDKNSGQRPSSDAGDTPPTQAARPDEPSAAVQAAPGSDGRIDEPQSCQVPSPCGASPLRLRWADIDASWLAFGNDKNSEQLFSSDA